MATVESLQRLQALVERLLPLADAQPGEPVRAEDWNTLVGALIDVARVTLAEADMTKGVPPHDHPDQVKLSWLDPALRDALGSGGLGSTGPTTKVGQFEIDLKRLQRRFDDVGGTVAGLTDRLTAVASRDLVREADFTQLRRNVDQVSGSGTDDLIQVRRQIDGVSRDVKRAIAAADRLTVNGELVDVGALATRIGSIEKLREGLTLPNGELLSAGRLEQRFSELTNTLVTEEDLDRALGTRQFALDDEQIKSLSTKVGASVRKSIATDLDALKLELNSRTDERLAGVDAGIRRQIEESAPSLREGVEQGVKERIEAGLADVRAAILEEHGRKIDAFAGSLRNELGQQVEGLRAGIGTAVGSALSDQLPGRLSGFDQRLGSALTRLDAAEGAIGRADTSVKSVTGRLGELTTELRGGLDNVNGRVTSELAAVQGKISATASTLEGRIAASETRFNGQIGTVNGRLDTAEGSIKRFDTSFGTVNGRLTELTNGLGQANTRLTMEVAGVRSDLTAARSEVDAKIGASEARTGTRLETRLGEANVKFETRLKETSTAFDTRFSAIDAASTRTPVVRTDRIGR